MPIQHTDTPTNLQLRYLKKNIIKLFKYRLTIVNLWHCKSILNDNKKINIV